MSSSKFIRATLANRLNADCSREEVKNNRYHYFFKFEKSMGWDWTEHQIQKSMEKFENTVELYEIHPSGVNDFEIEIRETARREGIDESQSGLHQFE